MKAKKGWNVMSWIYRLALVMSLFLSACSAALPAAQQLQPEVGVVYELSRLTTMDGVARVFAGMPNTMILANGDKYMLIWIMPNRGIAFYLVDAAKMVEVRSLTDAKALLGLQNGAMGNCVEVSCMIGWLQNRGWVVISAEAIRESVKVSLVSLLSKSITFMPTFAVFTTDTPVTIDELMEMLNPVVQQ